MGESDGFQGRRVADGHSRISGGIVTGLSLKFYTTAYTPAVLQVRSEASVKLEQSINKSCLLACRQQTVERVLKCLCTDLVSVYYLTKTTQTHTMYTSIAASPDYLCQDTQCKSTWSEIGGIPVDIELCNSCHYMSLYKECLRSRRHSAILPIENK